VYFVFKPGILSKLVVSLFIAKKILSR